MQDAIERFFRNLELPAYLGPIPASESSDDRPIPTFPEPGWDVDGGTAPLPHQGVVAGDGEYLGITGIDTAVDERLQHQVADRL